MTPQLLKWPTGCYAADPGKDVPCLRPQAERAGVRMEARQGQDARPTGGLIHDSRPRRATPIEALFNAASDVFSRLTAMRDDSASTATPPGVL